FLKRARDWRTLSTTPGRSGKTARPVPDRTRDTGSGRQACVNSRRTGNYRHTCPQIRGLRLWIT
ncbi:hypothetical protein FD764_27325, partial [Klebsiella pneumoniae]|nr:hypothetical protein [Klebsiella pneumoniae]